MAYAAPSIAEFHEGIVVKEAPISTGTTTKRKRKLRSSGLVSDGDLHKVLRMIPYQ